MYRNYRSLYSNYWLVYRSDNIELGITAQCTRSSSQCPTATINPPELLVGIFEIHESMHRHYKLSIDLCSVRPAGGLQPSSLRVIWRGFPLQRRRELCRNRMHLRSTDQCIYGCTYAAQITVYMDAPTQHSVGNNMIKGSEYITGSNSGYLHWCWVQ